MKRINISGIRTARRQLAVVLVVLLTGSALAACSSSSSSSTSSSTGTTGGSSASPTSTSVKKGLVVYFIPKDTQNPYEVLADQGGAKALGELGGKVVVSSGTVDTAAAQIPSIQAAIQAHANAIVIAGNDPKAVCPSLNQAAAAGIKILAFDSDVNCGSAPNHLFINQANTQTIGTSEVDILAKEINSSGQIAILSAAASATNQNSWIVYMKGIISPTTVGIQAAAQYLNTHKSLLSKIVLTGLGLPSQMKPYVLDGTVKQFELWNPSNLGYLAGYAAVALASGTTSLTTGATFKAGSLGSYTVLAPSAGTGPSVVLGPPTVFTAANVAKFNF